jgi:dynactin complex subunit
MSSNDDHQFQVGAKVGVRFRPGERGIIRYRGEVAGKPGIFLGIELNKATGKNNGTANGTHYFSCPPSHGIFVRAASLKLVTPAPSSAFDQKYVGLCMRISVTVAMNGWSCQIAKLSLITTS